MTFNDVVPFFQVRMNNRDHRKMLVVDGRTAFTGGINLADEYIGEKRRFGYWKDSCLQVTGDCVGEFVKMFFYLWNACRLDKEALDKYLPLPNSQKVENDDGEFCVQPYDDCPLDGHTVAEMVYVHIIDRAKKYVWFFTPYLILDEHMRLSLCKAAIRGVDVRIVTPGIPDKKITYRLTRANYKILMKAGVKIYEYTPGFIHSKNVISDDACAVVGTINLDYRSLYHHFENAVYFKDRGVVAQVKQDFEQTFSLSRECSSEYPKRGILGKLFDSILRVFETLM
jgi:cardiolipin synthase